MGDGGYSLFIVFNRATNLGNIGSSSWSCSMLVLFVGAEDSVCSWLNSTTLFASLPISTTLVPGDMVVVKGGFISAACDSIDCSGNQMMTQTVASVMAPLHPYVPYVSLFANSQFTVCSDVVLDPSGSVGNGGRGWLSVEWSVSGIKHDGSTIQSFLNTEFGTSAAINSIVTLPKHLFNASQYSISLTLTNFMNQSSTSTASFYYGVGESVPMVRIGGASNISMKASSDLRLYGYTEFSKCSASSSVVYSWSLLESNGPIGLISVSNDPWIYSLPSYSLVAGRNYMVEFVAQTITATSSATVFINVLSGSVHAIITGATTRYIMTDTTLDASNSYDDARNTTDHLTFSWSCVHGSGVNSGFPCGWGSNMSVLVPNSSFHALELDISSLEVDIIYVFSVTVTDELSTRTDSSNVTIIRAASSAANVQIGLSSISSGIVNYGTPCVFSASLVSSKTVFLSWEARSDGNLLVMQNATQTARLFHSNDTQVSLEYPLMLSVVDFPGGATINLRLSVYSYGSMLNSISSNKQRQLTIPSLTLVSYAEITFKVNLAPQGGSIQVSPTSGVAFETLFALSTSNWFDDASDLPLNFDFRYSVDYGISKLTVQSRSIYSSLSTIFPPGAFDSGQVIVFVRAFDNIGAMSSKSMEIIVISAAITDYYSTLQTLLVAPLMVQSTDQQLAIVNAVSAALNAVDCSDASPEFCASLNRQSCSSTSQTCSSCLSNYTGIVGDSNSYCHSVFHTTQDIGERCDSDIDCKYGLCVVGFCASPVQTCPLGANRTECSSKGSCEYRISGQIVNSSQCSVLDTTCYVRCVCSEGYGGNACQFSSTELTLRSSSRSLMCQRVSSVISVTDSSSSQIDTLSNTLRSVFDPYEISGYPHLSTCHNAFYQLLSSSVYVEGRVLYSYLDMSSKDTAQILVDVFSEFLVAANISSVRSYASLLVGAALVGMESGQTDILLTSDRFSVRLSRALSSELSASNQSVPLTEREQFYGANAINVEFDGDEGFCDDSTGYVSLGIGAYLVSPYDSNGGDLISSMLYTESIDFNTGPTRTSDSQIEGKYFVSLPFSSIQNFITQTHSELTEDGAIVTVYNETIPSCSMWVDNSDMIESRACSSCNLSTYSNDSVIFVCYDPSQICSVQSNFERRLSMPWTDTLESVDAVSVIYEAAALGSALSHTALRILTFNPFQINPKDAAGILATIAMLFVVTLGGMIYFYRWDRSDRDVFMKNDKEDKHDRLAKSKSFSAKLSASEASGKSFKSGVSDEKGSKSLHELWGVLIRRAMPMPVESLSEMSFFTRYIWHPIINHHHYFQVAGDASLNKSRFIVWTSAFHTAFLALFIDTLFFSVFYQDNGFCESHISETTCLAERNPIFDSTTCLWDTSSGCELNPPPETQQFQIVLSCVTLMIAIPIGAVFEYCLDEVCSKRPTPGASEVIKQIKKHWMMGNDMNAHQSSVTSVREESQQDNRLADEEFNLGVFSETMISSHWRSVVNCPEIASRFVDWAHIDSCSVLDEMQVILMKAQPYFDRDWSIKHGPWKYWDLTSGRLPPPYSFVHKLLYFCGLARYETRGSATLYRLKSYLERVRLKTNKVLELILGEEEEEESVVDWSSTIHSWLLGGADNRNSTDDEKVDKDVDEEDAEDPDYGRLGITPSIAVAMDRNQSLLQTFILEQLPPYHRFVLKRHCYSHCYLLPDLVPLWQWLGAWIVVIGSILFFIYWTLMWCLYSGNKTFQSWGSVLLATYLEDIFLVQMMKVWVVYISTHASLMPRLAAIQSVLEKVADEACQRYVPSNASSACGANNIDGESQGDKGGGNVSGDSADREESECMSVNGQNPGFDEVAVVNEDVGSPSSMGDCDLVQHFSKACRAARDKKLRHLPASLLLHCIRDRHIVACRETNYQTKMGLFAALLFTVPVAISLTVDHDESAEVAFERIFTIVVTSAYAGLALVVLYNLTASLSVICSVLFVIAIYSVYRHVDVNNQELRNLLSHDAVHSKRRQAFHRIEIAIHWFVDGLMHFPRVLFRNVIGQSADGATVEKRLKNWSAMNGSVNANAHSQSVHSFPVSSEMMWRMEHLFRGFHNRRGVSPMNAQFDVSLIMRSVPQLESLDMMQVEVVNCTLRALLMSDLSCDLSIELLREVAVALLSAQFVETSCGFVLRMSHETNILLSATEAKRFAVCFVSLFSPEDLDETCVKSVDYHSRRKQWAVDVIADETSLSVDSLLYRVVQVANDWKKDKTSVIDVVNVESERGLSVIEPVDDSLSLFSVLIDAKGQDHLDYDHTVVSNVD